MIKRNDVEILLSDEELRTAYYCYESDVYKGLIKSNALFALNELGVFENAGDLRKAIKYIDEHLDEDAKAVVNIVGDGNISSWGAMLITYLKRIIKFYQEKG